MTNKEHILALRKAYIRGCINGIGFTSVGHTMKFEREAKEKYPLPMITRPRVVCLNLHDDNLEYKIEHKTLFYRTEGQSIWKQAYSGYVEMLADLIKNPTEEVEDDS